MPPTIEISTIDGAMPALSAEPEGTPAGAVIVIQEAFGLTEHIGDVVDTYAAHGFRSLAPALFHRQGSPVAAYDDFEAIKPAMGALDAAGLAVDLDATLAHLNEEGFGAAAIGMVGYCMGGSVTLFAATRPGLGAAATYYGGGLSTGRFGMPPLLEIAASLRCPWIGHFGDLDKGIPLDDVNALRVEAAKAPVPTEVYVYEGADHGFNCNDRPAVYNEQAAALAFERTYEFFTSTLTT
jgi:carboxymethylenebutenolidase